MVFLYLFPLFNYHFLSIINTGKCPPPHPHPPLQLPSRRRPLLFGITVRNAGEFLFVCTILNIRKCRHGNASIEHYALRNDYVCKFLTLFIYLILEDVILTREEEDDDDGEDLAWERGKTRTFLFS